MVIERRAKTSEQKINPINCVPFYWRHVVLGPRCLEEDSFVQELGRAKLAANADGVKQGGTSPQMNTSR